MTGTNGFTTKSDLKKLKQCWQQQIDPILYEKAKYRDKEFLHCHQYYQILNMVNKIAKKVCVSAEV